MLIKFFFNTLFATLFAMEKCSFQKKDNKKNKPKINIIVKQIFFLVFNKKPILLNGELRMKLDLTFYNVKNHD